MLRSATLRLAHKSASFASFGGNGELRGLQDLIDTSKAVIQSLQKLSADYARAMEVLEKWGSSQCSNVSDSLHTARTRFTGLTSALDSLSNQETTIRTSMKTVRSQEEAVMSMHRRRQELMNQVGTAERKISKMTPAHPNLSVQQAMLVAFKQELEKLTVEIPTAGADLMILRTESVKDWMRIRLTGVADLARLAQLVSLDGLSLFEKDSIRNTASVLGVDTAQQAFASAPSNGRSPPVSIPMTNNRHDPTPVPLSRSRTMASSAQPGHYSIPMQDVKVDRSSLAVLTSPRFSQDVPGMPVTEVSSYGYSTLGNNNLPSMIAQPQPRRSASMPSVPMAQVSYYDGGSYENIIPPIPPLPPKPVSVSPKDLPPPPPPRFVFQNERSEHLTTQAPPDYQQIQPIAETSLAHSAPALSSSPAPSVPLRSRTTSLATTSATPPQPDTPPIHPSLPVDPAIAVTSTRYPGPPRPGSASPDIPQQPEASSSTRVSAVHLRPETPPTPSSILTDSTSAYDGFDMLTPPPSRRPVPVSNTSTYVDPRVSSSGPLPTPVPGVPRIASYTGGRLSHISDFSRLSTTGSFYPDPDPVYEAWPVYPKDDAVVQERGQKYQSFLAPHESLARPISTSRTGVQAKGLLVLAPGHGASSP